MKRNYEKQGIYYVDCTCGLPYFNSKFNNTYNGISRQTYVVAVYDLGPAISFSTMKLKREEFEIYTDRALEIQ